MRSKLLYGMDWLKVKVHMALTRKREGVDKILVTVGMCIIALLLCVVMKESLTKFINDIFTSMTTKANGILGGA